MVKEFSTVGSCSSRNIFARTTNDGYKQFFHINTSIEAVTLISLMSKPTLFDSKLMDSPNGYDNYCINHDLSKDYLNFIKTSNVEYLIIDTFFDVLFNVIILDKNKYITDSDRLKHTSLNNNVKDYERINIMNNFDEYYSMWTTACDMFFKHIYEFTNIKIILNCSRPVYKYIANNGQINHGSPSLYNEVPKNHAKFRNILDKYILEKYDVDVLSFNKNTLAYERHIWGLHPTHYEPKYYAEKTNQLNLIINRYDNLDYTDELNFTFRKIKRDINIAKFEKEDLNLKI